MCAAGVRPAPFPGRGTRPPVAPVGARPFLLWRSAPQPFPDGAHTHSLPGQGARPSLARRSYAWAGRTPGPDAPPALPTGHVSTSTRKMMFIRARFPSSREPFPADDRRIHLGDPLPCPATEGPHRDDSRHRHSFEELRARLPDRRLVDQLGVPRTGATFVRCRGSPGRAASAFPARSAEKVERRRLGGPSSSSFCSSGSSTRRWGAAATGVSGRAPRAALAPPPDCRRGT